LEIEIRKYFSKELNVIKKYRNDIKGWKKGTIDHLILEAKNKKLSKIDAIVYILETYFKEIMQ
jgi:hypothetical protein